MIITLPEKSLVSPKLVSPEEINSLHEELAQKLQLMPIFRALQWSFSDRMIKTYGQAEFADKYGNRAWIIKYSRKLWLLLSAAERKNLITHEFCHLAVEWYYGYDSYIQNKRVLSHGSQWRKLMEKCAEDPDMYYADELRGSDDPDVTLLSSLLLQAHETRAIKNSRKSK